METTKQVLIPSSLMMGRRPSSWKPSELVSQKCSEKEIFSILWNAFKQVVASENHCLRNRRYWNSFCLLTERFRRSKKPCVHVSYLPPLKKDRDREPCRKPHHFRCFWTSWIRLCKHAFGCWGNINSSSLKCV